MFTPIRFLSKEEIDQLDKKIKNMGFDGLVKDFLKKGWCKESAEILANALLNSVKKRNKNDT